jgi:hypothetical protein
MYFKIKIYRIIILHIVLYGCETVSLTLREECWLWVIENKVQRRIFGSKRNEVQGSGENYIMRSLMICNAHQMLLGVIKLRKMRWAGHVTRMGERRGVYRERENLADPGIDGRIILRCIIRKWDMGVWTGSR